MPGGIGLEDTEVAAKWDPNKQFTWRNPGFPQHDNHPVVQITWREAGAYCEWLSRKEGKRYRLPTEAEWEYACRAGTVTRFYNGNDLEEVTQISNCADATAHAVFPHWKGVKSSDGYIYTAPVGHYRPNNFGLYDMLGNVTEWCSDWQAADYYKHSPVDDPQGPALGTMHVARGAGFTHVGGAQLPLLRRRNLPPPRLGLSRGVRHRPPSEWAGSLPCGPGGQAAVSLSARRRPNRPR